MLTDIIIIFIRTKGEKTMYESWIKMTITLQTTFQTAWIFVLPYLKKGLKFLVIFGICYAVWSILYSIHRLFSYSLFF